MFKFFSSFYVFLLMGKSYSPLIFDLTMKEGPHIHNNFPHILPAGLFKYQPRKDSISSPKKVPKNPKKLVTTNLYTIALIKHKSVRKVI